MRWIARLMRRVGLLQFDFLVRNQVVFPEPATLCLDEVVVVCDAGVLKWACLRCPGGCGADIALSLNQSRRPRWRISYDFWKRPTVEPSVHQKNSCGCHFFLRRGRIDWCQGGRPASRNEPRE